ncbi:uncharacterized protein P174DRAFT_471791 [Aspergillus novofumigatus IBT 16806]|uniref:Uncharacterized protein n=1 Tax=Aspergillus novofumigatus (strain IBT 16806) TaxID=1392255 RepID=A0A2I1BUQ0_ASPN1|nr:uncharacterized protein P174DRAFT_471791 [Aspergillus novofumigatus IBT 16806]PKX89084.1 hypothetical protein P174DRAFT_471791 [Aspergillus novofumigatus IBT 16806]
MATCYKELGEGEKQYIKIKKAIAAVPFYHGCTYTILRFHNETGRFEETISLVKEFTDAKVPDKEYSQLTEFLWQSPTADEEVIEYLADAGQETGNLKLIGWMRILNTYGSAKEEGQIGSAKVIASSKLAQLWLCHAINAGLDSPKAEEYVGRLEQLVSQYRTKDTSALWVAARAWAISLGVWYCLIGQHDDARALLTPSVKQAIQILSDDDPENDDAGLTDLQNALLAAGDAKNVITIAYALG